MGPDAGMFQLAANTGTSPTVARIVSFKASPDYDMPGDSNGDNVYEVTVRTSDGTNHKDMQVAVKVTDVNEVGRVALSSQDAQIGVELTATLSDDDGGVPDGAEITDQKWTWHRLPNTTTDSADAAAANAIAGATSAAYTPVSADNDMILAAMVSYTDRHGMTTATSSLTRAVRAAVGNQAPMFSDGASTLRTVMEDAAADETDLTADDVGGPIRATDANGDPLAYTLSGADASTFKVAIAADDTTTTDVSEAGWAQIELADGAKLDYETRSRYSVTLTANDGSGAGNATAMITVNIYVTDVDEVPAITGHRTVGYAENGTGMVATYRARDPEGATAIQWSLLTTLPTDVPVVDGAELTTEDIEDSNNFRIDSGGVLSFESSPNFESPTGGGTADDSNTHQIVVVASDGTMSGYHKALVTVTNVPEPGSLTWTVTPSGGTATAGLREFRVAAMLTPTLADSDGIVDASVSWQWYRGSTAIAAPTGTGATYTTVEADVNNRIRVQASYRETATSPVKTVSFTWPNAVLAARAAADNEAPVAASTANRGVAENAEAGTTVGGPITATDDDDNTLTYTVPADNAFFTIDVATGQLRVKQGATLDHETAATQTVFVAVDDP